MAEEHTQGQITDTDPGDVCEPCKFDNIMRPAAGWCEDCDEKLCDNCHTAHRKLKQSRDHKFWSIEEMVGRKQRPRVPNRCEKHDGKRLEYFCGDHSELGCGQCFVAAHRQCINVVCLSDFKTIGSEEFKALETLLENLASRLHDMHDKTGRNKDLSVSHYDKTIADIEGAGEKLKSLIDRLVKEQVEKVKKAKEEDMRNLTEIGGITAEVADKVNTNREMLTAEKADNIQLYITMKHVQTEAKGLTLKLDSVKQKNTVTEKLFVLNPDLAAVLEKVTELGTIKEKKMFEMETATDEVVEDLEVRRFQQATYGWSYDSGVPDAIQVSTDKNVRLLFVLLFPCKTGDTDVTLAVMEGTKCLLRCKSTHARGTKDVVDVKVVNERGDHGVTLRAGQCYDIVVTISGNWSEYGNDGQNVVTVNRVKFSFTDSTHSKNHTNTNRGQIAGFKFTHL